MPRRRKSIYDIREQLSRIWRLGGGDRNEGYTPSQRLGNVNFARWSEALRVSQEYIHNILTNPQYSEDSIYDRDNGTRLRDMRPYSRDVYTGQASASASGARGNSSS